jgi:hypothetical protein
MTTGGSLDPLLTLHWLIVENAERASGSAFSMPLL